MNTVKPIKIGYSMSLTGPLGANGQTALLAHRIWEEEVNGRGGLLGRPVQLISVDDKTDASLVAGIYRQLLDDDQVDLVDRVDVEGDGFKVVPIRDGFRAPTSVTRVGSTAWVSEGQLSFFFDRARKGQSPSLPFRIYAVPLSKGQTQ